MDNTLFAIGLFVFGFTLIFLMPASMQKSWKELNYKPPAGDTILLLMRFMGIFLLFAGAAFLSGAIDVSSVIGGNAR